MSRYFKDGAWWVSPYDFVDGVFDDSVACREITIHDATLRDGEQTPGVVFSVDDKIRIAEKLYEVGIRRIEAGMPAVSQMDYDAICEITKRLPDADVYTFARAMRKDVDMARDSGAKGVVVEVPIGRPKLEYQFHWTWKDVLEKSVDCIEYAKSQGLKVLYFPYDTTRADFDDLCNLVEGIMANAQPTSIGIVDTMGCATPAAIGFLVRKMKQMTDGLPVEVHTHNDFGMAVATELAAVASGCDAVHACVNGLGERTGNAALEELILNFQILMGCGEKYDMKALGELCTLVSNLSGIPLAQNKPFSGSRNYVRESGIGVDLVVNRPLAMFATDPTYFGKKAEVVLGKKSGRLSVEYKLDQLGMSATSEQVHEILEKVKDLGIRKKGLVSDDEFREIADGVIG